MSGFTPLNPEDRIEGGIIEIDETREIQIEDALKLYQNALKLHSQGPQFHDQTAQAYEELFASEIFRYPDAVSQFTHDELSTGPEDGSAAILDENMLEPTVTADGQPSSLPQILHLAFKNRGQFALDTAKSSSDEPGSDQQSTKCLSLPQACRIAIGDFAEALERDDTDIDLWRKAARVSDVLSSKRLARFCLESVFVGDDGTVSEDADLLGLDEAYAIGDLGDILKALKDDLSASQLPNMRAKDALYTAMKRRLDPYPYMPSRLSEIDYTDPRQRPLGFQPLRHVLRPGNRSWLAIGTVIYQALVSDDQYAFDFGPCAALAIEIPGEPDSSPSRDLDPTSAIEKSSSSSTEQDPRANSTQNDSEVPNEIVGDQTESMDQVEGGETASIDEQAAAQLTDQIAATPIEEAQPSVPEEKVDKSVTEAQPLTLLTRKRSSTSAGNEDPGRAKSKRLRAREANADTTAQEEDVANNLAQWYEDQHEELAQIDRWMFSTANELLAKCGVEDLGTLDELKQVVAESDKMEMTHNDPFCLAVKDLRNCLSSWKEEHGHAILSGNGAFNIEGKFPDTQSAGLAVFLEHSKPNARKIATESAFPDSQGFDRFAREINNTWIYGHHAVLLFIESLLFTSLPSNTKGMPKNAHFSGGTPSSYLITLWPPSLKQLVVQMIVKEDEYMYGSLQKRIRDLEGCLLGSSATTRDTWTEADITLVELVQTLFELHLDIYSLITHPNSEVDRNTRILQRDRLGRWGETASGLMTWYSQSLGDSDLSNPLILRFMWASTTHATKAEDVSKEHVILCLQDLRRLIHEAGDPMIYLQNNAAMPEISASAVEQEISRLSTLEFFTDIFSNDSKDPIVVINSLEPVLDPNLDPTGSEGSSLKEQEQNAMETAAERTAQMTKLRTFLEQGDASLKLFLWRRLEEAYTQIGDQSMIVSCWLRSIEIILEELQSNTHCEKPSDERQVSLLRWLLTIDKVMIQLLKIVLNETNAFDNIYYEHLQSSMAAVARLSRLLHSFTLLDDSFRIGEINAPLTKASGTKLFEKAKDKLREMQIRAWLLQYALIKEGIVQNKSLFNTPFDDRARYLRFVHNAIGPRGYCKYSNKLLLKVLKADLLSMPTEDDYEADISQVLFDLHHLKLVSGPGDANHDCPTESLDKATALKIVPLIMTHANRMNVRDLVKSDLKATIDKVQLVIGMPKSSPALLHNRRLISAFLKSPINPRDLYRSTQGIGDLPTKAVQSENEVIASQGWYYLQGYISLAKFKSVKRVSPTPTVDLDIAAAFFKQDLEHGVEKWETWYRFAQAFEAKIEDDLLWTADKVNNNRAELASLQRNTIHCYSMALAVAIRTSDDALDATSKISDLFTEFATLLYAASREPLSMDAFSLESFERHYSSDATQHMYRAPPFPPMQPYSVWNFASYLFRQAMASKPRRWINHYLLGKCLWKMYTRPINPNLESIPSITSILDAFVEAINTLPERRDSRAEPVLEPHFKVVSTVHKLVHGGKLSPIRGSETLQASPYARKEHLSLDDEDGEGEGWDAYIIKILHSLEKADKSNWHHRIVARLAHIHYDDNPSRPVAALAARHQFMQQIFTKTMTLQVWKPENERPGRHFVYTSRYVLFFVRLLEQVNDRASLDALVRRIRRKQSEYLNHVMIWEQVCTTYVRLLRRVANVPEGYMETIFKPIHYEVFGRVSDALEKWAHDLETSEIKVDVLRDALELKKLNNNLMKGTMFEDLVTDTYASVYEVFVQSQASREAFQAQGPEQASTTPSTHATTPQLRGGSAEPPARGEVDGQNGQITGTKLPVHSMLLAGAQVDGTSTDTATETASNQMATPPWPQRQPSPGPYGNPPFHVHTLGQASAAPMPPKPHLGRPKQITRREIQRKAEAVLGKPPPIPTPKLLNAPGLPSSKGRIAVEVPQSPSLRRDRATVTDQSAVEASHEDEESKQTLGDDGDGGDKEVASGRSSVGDQWDHAPDADNEGGNSSELSDIDAEGMHDEVEGTTDPRSNKPSAKLMFPNLVKADAADSSTIDSEDVSMADGGDEGDGDGPIEGEVEGEEVEEEEVEGEIVDEPDEEEGEEGNKDQESDSRPADEDSQKMPGGWIDSQPMEE